MKGPFTQSHNFSNALHISLQAAVENSTRSRLLHLSFCTPSFGYHTDQDIIIIIGTAFNVLPSHIHMYSSNVHSVCLQAMASCTIAITELGNSICNMSQIIC